MYNLKFWSKPIIPDVIGEVNCEPFVVPIINSSESITLSTLCPVFKLTFADVCVCEKRIIDPFVMEVIIGDCVCTVNKLPNVNPDGYPVVFWILIILLKLWFGKETVYKPVPIYDLFSLSVNICALVVG